MERFTKNSALIGTTFLALLAIGGCNYGNDGAAENAGGSGR